MNTLCLSTSLSLSSSLLLSSSSHTVSPFLSFIRFRGPLLHSLTRKNNIINIKRNNNNNINKSLLLSSSRPNNLLLSSPIINGAFRGLSTPLFRQTGINNNNNNNYYNNHYNKIIKRNFHATTPLRAGVHAFRLASFVAPIVMRQVRTWIGTPSERHFFKRLLVVIALLLGIPAVYVYTHLETTPYTDRVRFVALTSDDEAELGELTFNQLVEEHESNFIPGHHHFVSKVTEVANRIIEACDRPDIKWEVRLIDSPVTNAFAIPGGKIFVFSGLLDVTENDDGLAFILGHEVAHVLARHGAEQMTIGKVMLGFSVLLSAIFGDNIGSFGISRVISLLTELRYSRSMEREADYIGLLLMQKAKYDISEAPKVWERMVQKTGSDGDQIPFLSTHPSHGDRIQDISKWVEEIKAENKQLVA